ncbi:mitochondrial threonyl-tRNA synthetase [Glomus cerebriforme]|uniref:threonine--tRNA ligase n=1 Tax=Glomus cerebriforme TaxID=658196 RepID=A0A397SWC8_9GLOM|nr:mitochondrial threonyl-tRNA synthetase [Glomus cerebriforme]
MLRSWQLRYVKRNNKILSGTFDIQCKLNLYRKISTGNVHRRLLIWEAEKKRQEDRLNVKTQNTIDITLMDGTVKQGIAGVTTPLECVKGISHELSNNSIMALINSHEPYDMNRPLTNSCTLQFLPFEPNDSTTKDVFWHSTSHVLGLALETKYGDDILLCDGPSLKQGGFFYEFLLKKRSDQTNNGLAQISKIDQLHEIIAQLIRSPEIRKEPFDSEELREILKIMNERVSQNYPFEHLVVTKDIAYDLFSNNPFKLYYLSEIPENEQITIYKCGSFIDLCRGPHIPHTGHIGAIDLLKCANVYWTPDLDNDKNSPQSIVRIYGISFPNTHELKFWKRERELAQKFDHRMIAKSQQLFLTHPLSPGSVLMLPHGTRIFQKLQNYIRVKYRKFGYEEVMTPTMFKKEIWETSGHWQNYQTEMFTIHDNEYGVYGLKPMNCPGHCLIFDSAPKSFRDLPLRLADFGSLHRNETSGSLSGLTRVRQFHQDDAHIFCRESQIFEEISSTLSFIDSVYKDLRFPNYEIFLSTRPNKNFIGEIKEWDYAEDALKKALNATGRKWSINPGDAAFYGPKIDIMVEDVLHRMHQTATVQLDFQLPKRFKLKYRDEKGTDQTPIIIHRAILGSVERIMAILIEHTGGKWPFWLSPRQAIVIPIGGLKFLDYAEHVCNYLKSGKSGSPHCYFVDVDRTTNSLNKMIKTAQLSQYNFMIIVGEKERETQTINVRRRDGGPLGNMTIDELLNHFNDLSNNNL